MCMIVGKIMWQDPLPAEISELLHDYGFCRARDLRIRICVDSLIGKVTPEIKCCLTMEFFLAGVYSRYIMPPETSVTNSTPASSFALATTALSHRLSMP